MHSLLHLADDYDQFGQLDNCSAFPFENYMKTLKGMIRKHEKPLQQVIRRYEEQCEIQITKLNEWGNWTLLLRNQIVLLL